jgi:hypothetical protein
MKSMPMDGDERVTRWRRVALIYCLVVVGVALALDAAGVGPLSERYVGVVAYLLIMGGMLLKELVARHEAPGASPAERRAARHVVWLSLAAIAGAPLVYVLGRSLSAGFVQAALMVLIVGAVITEVVRRRRR